MADETILHQTLGAALVAARAEFTPVRKTHVAKIDSARGKYEYRFATLDEINEATQPALQKHGLAIVQRLSSPDGATVGVQTIILFGAEQLDCGTLVMPTGGTPQSVGSAVTYARRYGVTAALMIATEEDDDAQTAQAATAKAQERPATSPAPRPSAGGATISEARQKRLWAIAAEHKWTRDEVRDLLTAWQVEHTSDIKVADYDEVIKSLEAGPAGRS